MALVSRFSVFALLYFLLSGNTVNAQERGAVLEVNPPIGATTTNIPFLRSPGPTFPTPLGSLGTDKAYSYFDANLPTWAWGGNGRYSNYLFLEIGERITLDGDGGFVDSVSVFLDSVSRDSVHVSLYPDTLYDVGGGRFYHLLNFFSATVAPYAATAIQSIAVHKPSWVTVPFPHVKVPKTFFVMLTPTDDGAKITNFFLWRTDKEAPRSVLPDNARSAAIMGDFNTGMTYSRLLDGLITLQGDSVPLFTNFYTTVYADPNQSSVAALLTPDATLDIYPNPANSSSFVKVSGVGANAKLTIRDMLGRTQWSASGSTLSNGPVRIPVSELPAGAYQIELTDRNIRLVRPFIVVR